MKFLAFSIASFVVVVMASFLVPPIHINSFSPSQVLGNSDISDYKTMPILSLTSDYPTFTAQSVYVYDVDSDISLYEKNPFSQVLPASTTKIITALVALDYYTLEEVIIVRPADVDGQKMGLATGEKIKVIDLLYGLLLFSANDSAEQLALNYPGGKATFIESMNVKAKEIGMQNSNFQNPQGFEHPFHRSTAEDMVKAGVVALEDETIAKIVSTTEYTAASIDGVHRHKMKNINQLLGKVDGVLGIKTGWTENAKENLVTYVNRNGHNIVIAVLGSEDRFGETEKLINWIFESYQWRLIPR